LRILRQNKDQSINKFYFCL